jgi:pimeloyl-ACP methyl ester carboxylesterase
VTDTAAATAVGARECRLVTIPSTDGRRLTAALYEPESTARAALLYVHGKGGNFYTGPGRYVPAVLKDEAFRHLSINLRSHDLAYTRDDCAYVDFENGSTEADGGYWEDYDTGLQDIGAAVEFLRELDDVPVVLVGKSSGGFYAALYCAQDERVAGQVLVSPVVDNKRSLPFWFPGPDGVDRALAAARDLVTAGQGGRLIPLDRWFYAVSAQTLLQRAAQPDDLWLDSLRTSRAAVCLAWGSAETRSALWRQLLDGLPKPRNRGVEVPGAGHDYLGQEHVLAAAVAEFVTDLVDGAI